MTIVWIDIQDFQSSTSAKILINYYFNLGSYITTIQDANINSSIPYVRIAENKNVPSLCVEPKIHIALNIMDLIRLNTITTLLGAFKTNFSCLETKQGELYPYIFKYLNYKGNYQANSNSCSFWRYCFNRKWHTKNHQKLWESKNKSIYLATDSV